MQINLESDRSAEFSPQYLYLWQTLIVQDLLDVNRTQSEAESVVHLLHAFGDPVIVRQKIDPSANVMINKN